MLSLLVFSILVALPAHASDATSNLSRQQILDHFDLTDKYRSKFERQFRDLTFSKFPDPTALAKLPLSLSQTLQIEGNARHLTLVPAAYRYDVIPEDETVVIEVRVHFKNATPEEFARLAKSVSYAATDWNRFLPKYAFTYKYRFLAVEDAKAAHFSVTLKDKTHGPYFSYWGRDWSSAEMAHEIGHMMGLVDEYETIPVVELGWSGLKAVQTTCDPDSIMCSVGRSPMQIHHYIILRRIFLTLQQNP
jgi:hypothetical protein